MESEIGGVEGSRIHVRGRDLVDELMGHVTFTRMIFITLTGRPPEPSDERILDAVLVSLVDHGVNSSSLVARLTYRAAPDALQGAVAAGLLNAGDRVLGAMENCGRMLSEGLSDSSGGSVESTARQIVSEYRERGLRIPGLGHLLHKLEDPRTTRLFDIAEESGRRGPYIKLLEEVADEVNRRVTSPIPINVDGSIAAVLLEVGFDWRILRGFALMSRIVGLVAHVDEERRTGSAGALVMDLMSGNPARTMRDEDSSKGSNQQSHKP